MRNDKSKVESLFEHENWAFIQNIGRRSEDMEEIKSKMITRMSAYINQPKIRTPNEMFLKN